MTFVNMLINNSFPLVSAPTTSVVEVQLGCISIETYILFVLKIISYFPFRDCGACFVVWIKAQTRDKLIEIDGAFNTVRKVKLQANNASGNLRVSTLNDSALAERLRA